MITTENRSPKLNVIPKVNILLRGLDNRIMPHKMIQDPQALYKLITISLYSGLFFKLITLNRSTPIHVLPATN